jgi:hypothetical protein
MAREDNSTNADEKRLARWNTSSVAVTSFQGRRLPEPGHLAGYAALIDQYRLLVVLPPMLAAIGDRHTKSSTDVWQILTPRHAPLNTLSGHLTFALKWEGVQLGVLAALFQIIEDAEIEQIVSETPTGAYARRLWFLYEWLTGRTLSLPDTGKVKAVPVVDPELQFALAKSSTVTRQKVINNLPGTSAFCPLVRRTPKLNRYVAAHLPERASEISGHTHPDLLARAAAFMLLADSKASFAIEGEHPPAQRIARWGQAIAEAGQVHLSREELERLQRIVIGDARFVPLGLRTEGGFVGERDRSTGEPLPDHISAKADDLTALVEGMVAFDDRSSGGGSDPVIAAAVLAFGFVYIHPFVDGNGRLHRWLIHHVLARGGFNPPGVVFPISAAILRRLHLYRDVLESYSRPLLKVIDWAARMDGNVEVRNDTANFYRFFDATAHAEFLFDRVAETVEEDLPREVQYLKTYDAFVSRIEVFFDMPKSTLDLLWRFLQQNEGKLSKRAREREFSKLTESETSAIQEVFAEVWATADNAKAALSREP